MMSQILIYFTFITGLVIVTRIIYLLLRVQSSRYGSSPLPASSKSTTSVMAVLGSGGHTKEMLALFSNLDLHFQPRNFIVASTDDFSIDKLKTVVNKQDTIDKIPRSRQVRQSYISSVMTTVYATMLTLPVILRHKPNLLIVNGPGTCIPVCFWCFLLTTFFVCDVRIVYIESICRVTSLSLTGKLLYFVADCFLVQWPELAKLYPRAQYIGKLL